MNEGYSMIVHIMKAVIQLLKKILPKEWIFTASHVKKALTPGGFRIETYSGDGEDIILNKYLFNKQKTGFYVDVGSFHPKYISNTYTLHKRGWRGMNIDPNPKTQQLYKRYRPNDINLQMGVAKTDSVKTYYSFSHAGVNTFDEIHASKKQQNNWNHLLGTEQVNCKPLSAIFADHLPPDTTIDVLDVDVEMMDLEVLESNNWDKYCPSVVLVEDREFRNNLTQSKIYQFLSEKGFIFHSYMNITLIMVHTKKVSSESER